MSQGRALILLLLAVALLAGCGGGDGGGDGGGGGDDGSEGGGAVASEACEPLGPQAQAALDAVVDAGAPGAIGLERSDDTDACAAAGVADQDSEVPMKPTDRWQIASVTKVFTATVVLQLVGEDELSLDDTVEDWLPGLVPRGDEITVRMLLDHSSGLETYADAPGYEQLLAENGGVATPRELVGLATKEPLLFEPGKGYHYSDTNTDLAGLIAQEVTGQPLGTIMREKLFAPLELRNTSFEPYKPDSGATAHGYDEKGNDVLDLGPTAVRGWADAAIVSNAPDLATFFSALLGGDVLDQPELDVMLTRNPYSGDDNGLTGLFVEDQDCEDGYGHEGRTPGYLTQVAASRDGSTVAVSFANATDDTDAIYDALGELGTQLYCED